MPLVRRPAVKVVLADRLGAINEIASALLPSFPPSLLPSGTIWSTLAGEV